MIIKTVLIDDDPQHIEILKEAIDEIHDVEVIAHFNSGEDFFKVFKKLNFELCFIDYHLPGQNGFKCAQKLTGKKIILASSESIPADEALELREVVDVIRIGKPLNMERLTKAIKRVRDGLLMDRGYVIFRVYPNNVRQIKLDDIICIEAEGEIKYILTKQERIKTQSYKIEQVLEKLPDRNFCQINRSQVLNIDYFHSYMSSDSIKLTVDFPGRNPQPEFTVSDKYYDNFASKVGLDT